MVVLKGGAVAHGLIVSVLDSRSSLRVQALEGVTALLSLARHLNLSAFPHPEV